MESDRVPEGFFPFVNQTRQLNLVSVVPFLVYQLFFTSFYFFLTIAICMYFCFTEKVLFQFFTFGFVSHTCRIFNKTIFYNKFLYSLNLLLI